MIDKDKTALLEGIIIGIYGNWLISLFDKLTFSSTPKLFQIEEYIFQAFFIILSIICLILLLSFGIFGGRYESHHEVIFLGFGHIFPIILSLSIQQFQIKDILFLSIGIILFSMIYLAEFIRAPK